MVSIYLKSMEHEPTLFPYFDYNIFTTSNIFMIFGVVDFGNKKNKNKERIKGD
jgi:hypothetical protein